MMEISSGNEFFYVWSIRCLKHVNIINILQATFAPIFLYQKLKSQTVIREKLSKALLYVKVLVKSNPEVSNTRPVGLLEFETPAV